MRIIVLSMIFLMATSRRSNAESLVFPPYGHSYGIRKATPKHLFMFFGPRTAFDDPQGLATCKMASRDDPTTKSDDDEVVVYGVNSGRHQLIYNTSMWALALYGKQGSGTGQFQFPKGVAAAPNGNVYVADWGNNRIVHLFNPKRQVQWVGAFNGASADDPGLCGPAQVGLDADGIVYVTDSGNRRIMLFDPSGRAQRSIPLPGRTLFEEGPTTLAIADGRDRWSHFRGDRIIFCADRKGRRLWKISFDGVVIDTMNMPGAHAAGYGAIDYYHNFWVTSQSHHCVLKFDRNLKLLDIFGGYGEGDNQFIEPRGIAIWKRYGQTFIAEKTGAQYYWIGTCLKSKELSQTGKDSWRLRVNVAEYSYLSLFVPLGADTNWFLRRQWIHPGGVTVGFKNLARNPAAQPPMATILLEPTYSSYTYYSWIYPLSGNSGETRKIKGGK